MKTVQSSLQGETHNQYRNRVGRISRNQHLMSQKVDPSQRREEIKRVSEASEKIEKKVKMEVEGIAKGSPSFRQKQIAHDKARGAYESRTFLEATPRLKEIVPAEDIEGMKAQYEARKVRTSGGELPERSQSPVTDSEVHHRREEVGASA